uniref:Uncharacterized protein n=1 Tax=Oryza punctata TaxID=4537 RepID=A0A0E0M3N2_ORYPU
MEQLPLCAGLPPNMDMVLQPQQAGPMMPLLAQPPLPVALLYSSFNIWTTLPCRVQWWHELKWGSTCLLEQGNGLFHERMSPLYGHHLNDQMSYAAGANQSAIPLGG